MRLLDKIYAYAFIWGGTHMFKYIDIWKDDKDPDYVGAITFSNNEEYVKKVGEIDLYPENK